MVVAGSEEGRWLSLNLQIHFLSLNINGESRDSDANHNTDIQTKYYSSGVLPIKLFMKG